MIAREKLLSFRKFHIKGLYFLQKLSFFIKADFGIFEFFYKNAILSFILLYKKGLEQA